MNFTVRSASIVFVLCTTCFINSAKLPETFERCKRKDPNLNECLKSAIQKAVRDLKPGRPSLHMLPIDPLDVTTIVIEEGAGRPVNIKLKLNHVKCNGLSSAIIQNVRADLDERTLDIDGLLPVSFLEGDYEMDGKFLVLPLKGKGKCRLDFNGLIANVKIKAEEKKKDSKSYWNIVKFDIDIKDMEKFQVNFENLFNGDKALGENTNKVLNDNWKTFLGRTEAII